PYPTLFRSRLPAVEGRPPAGARDARLDGDVHAAPHLLPELQVRVLTVPGARRPAPRGARARLLLHLLVRAVGDLGRHGPRDADGVGPGRVRRADAAGRASLAARHAGAGPGADPAARQPPQRLPRQGNAGAGLRLRPAAVG